MHRTNLNLHPYERAVSVVKQYFTPPFFILAAFSRQLMVRLARTRETISADQKQHLIEMGFSPRLFLPTVKTGGTAFDPIFQDLFVSTLKTSILTVNALVQRRPPFTMQSYALKLLALSKDPFDYVLELPNNLLEQSTGLLQANDHATLREIDDMFVASFFI